MKKITIYQVDSFTTEKLKGNPAGVVPDAEILEESEMQAIARELNNSETAFILPPDGNDHEVRLRYFTPTTEVPSCGHATVAAHYVRAFEGNFSSKKYNHKIPIGVLEIEIIKSENGNYKVVLTQGKPEFGTILEGKTRDDILEALGLTDNDLDNRAPIQIVDTGHSKVMIGIKERTKLNQLRPQFSSLAEISSDIKCNGFYVFTFDSDIKDILVHGRMFAPAIGINEDPVTGNANGPLGAYIIKYKLAKAAGKQFHFRAQQGEAINRTGLIDVYVDIENEEPVKVRVGGEAVIAFKTEINLQ